ncbi:hypothetical protein C5D36_02260 [Rathayibacter sp. AY1C6]|nr:hypothetical protein C5D36_02260 [Rathayibacter sp. AY1C6]
MGRSLASLPHVSSRTSLRRHRQNRRRGAIGTGVVLAVVGAALFAGVSAHAATAPDLGTAEDYSVLAASTVTNTGSSVLDQSVGVSPLTAVTGFPPGRTDGVIHRGDAEAAQAQADVGTAYGQLASQATTAQIDAEIGGRTLKPGVYTAAGPVGVTGTLTLDAEGVNEAVFVIRAASTLTTASSSTVALINGA